MSTGAIIAALILWGASIGGTAWWFYGSGQDSEKAKQADIDKAVQQTRDAAMKGAGDAIAQIKITNTTIQRKVESVTREVPVYRSPDCRHAPGVRDDIDGALRGEPTGGGVVPEAASGPR